MLTSGLIFQMAMYFSRKNRMFWENKMALEKTLNAYSPLEPSSLPIVMVWRKSNKQNLEWCSAVATETTRPHAWFVTSLPVVRLIVLLFCAVVLLANKSAKSRGLALVCKAQ